MAKLKNLGFVVIEKREYDILNNEINWLRDRLKEKRDEASYLELILNKTICENNKLHDHIIDEKVYISRVSKTSAIDDVDVLECIELGITSDEIEAFLSRCNGRK